MIETIPVAELSKGDRYIGFSGVEFIVVSKVLTPEQVTVEFAEPAYPTVTATATWTNLDQPVFRIKD